MDLPEPQVKLRQAVLRYAACDQLMAQVLALSGTVGLAEVLVAAKLAPDRAGPGWRINPEHVANVLAQLTAPARPSNVDAPLSTSTPAQADPGLYDRLRNLAKGAV